MQFMSSNNNFRPMPGYVLCELLPGDKEIDGFTLPSEDPSRLARIIAVGPPLSWWEPLVRRPLVKKGDIIVVNPEGGKIDDDHVVVPIHLIRCKIPG